MRLSVVVPVYNAEGTLSRCIDSLLQQEVEGYEVLLVDDGSTDGSFALMEAYQKRRPDVIRIFQKPNGGLSDARNFGMDQARGEFLSFVDSDDFVVEGCYPALLNTAEETGCDVLFFDACRDFLSHQQPMAALPNVGESSFVTTKTYLLSMPCAWNKLIKTRLFRWGSGMRIWLLSPSSPYMRKKFIIKSSASTIMSNRKIPSCATRASGKNGGISMRP